jgi:hypothetical protein
MVDIETEDGIEFGATVLGPSESLDKREMRVRFADGVIDDWPIEDFKNARSEEEAREEPSMSSTVSLVQTHSWEERWRRESIEELCHRTDHATAAASTELDAVEARIQQLELVQQVAGCPRSSYLALILEAPTIAGTRRLGSTQAAVRRLALALALLPAGQDLTPGGGYECALAEVDSDVIVLIGAHIVADQAGFICCGTTIVLTRSPEMEPQASPVVRGEQHVASEEGIPPESVDGDIASTSSQVQCSSQMFRTPYQSAVCGTEMSAGRHYAEFTFLDLGWAAMIGVVGPDFDPVRGHVAHQSEQGWMLGSMAASCFHAGTEHQVSWSGFTPNLESPQCRTVGILLDVDAGEIAVYVKGERRCKSIFKKMGEKQEDGEEEPPVAPFVLPLRWYGRPCHSGANACPFA